MNNKQVACGIIIFLIVCLVQGTLWMNGRMAGMQKEATAAKQKAEASARALRTEQKQLVDLRTSSEQLIEYLKVWQPYFDAVDSPQNAELKISLRVKEDNLVNLSQRYEVVGQKNPSLPMVMRAYLSFEDNYSRLLNWLGRMESQLPTLRVSSLRLTRGTGPNDVKMDLILEQPLMKQK